MARPIVLGSLFAVAHTSLICTMWIPIAPPRVDSSKGPHRMNRAHWPTKGNWQLLYIFCIFPVHGKNGFRWPQMGPGGFFPTNPDLANILGRTDLNFEKFHFFGHTFLDFQVSKFPNSQISRYPDLQIPRCPCSQISRCRRRRRRRTDSQIPPSLNAPRDQMRRKGPCCDMFVSGTCWVLLAGTNQSLSTQRIVYSRCEMPTTFISLLHQMSEDILIAPPSVDSSKGRLVALPSPMGKTVFVVRFRLLKTIKNTAYG